MGRRLGLTVCEEVWNDRDFWPKRLYARDPVCELADQGADVLINISSSPFTIGKAQVRRQMIRQEAVKNARPFVYVNQVGGNDELVFDGHSLVFDAEGTSSCAGATSRRTSSSAMCQPRAPRQSLGAPSGDSGRAASRSIRRRRHRRGRRADVVPSKTAGLQAR